MQRRKFIQQPPAQISTIQEEEALLDTLAVTGKDQGKIASLAYLLFEQRGREDGHDLDDWFEAEQRIVSRREGRGF